MSIRVSKEHGVNPSVGLCFYCQKAKEVVLLGAMSPERRDRLFGPGYANHSDTPHSAAAPHQATYNLDPCDECKSFMDQGIILISVDPKKSITQVRDHTCLRCRHEWTEPVRLSIHTSNISGEAREQCSACQAWSISSSPMHPGQDALNPWRTGGWVVLTEAAVSRLLSGSMLGSVLHRRFAFVEDEVWDMIGLPRGPMEEEGKEDGKQDQRGSPESPSGGSSGGQTSE